MLLNALSQSALGRPQTLHVHSAFEHAINLIDERGHILSLVTRDKPLIPAGAKIDTDAFPEVSVTDKVLFWGEGIAIKGGKTALVINLGNAPEMDLDVHESVTDTGPLKEALSRFVSIHTNEHLTYRWEDEAGAHERVGVPLLTLQSWQDERFADIHRGDIAIATIGLLGLGPGLTPSGDDFICGWLWAWHITADTRLAALCSAIKEQAGGTTDISRNFLYHACHGRFVECLHVAMSNPQRGFAWLSEQGFSSGMDTLAGAHFGLRAHDLSLA